MKDGGSAFPEVISEKDNNGQYDTFSYGGMTLRDYIATQVYTELVIFSLKNDPCADVWRKELGLIAKDAYLAADAMLAERGKE